nr:uncharacterized protein LOC118050486 [Populus alba]
MKGICDEDCWQLFARHAFSSANSGAFSHLETFGREIARNCKGLPLAAKTLGGLLHSEGDVKEWEKKSNSNMWGLSNENIPPALTLSYYYLPSHLKRCFAYCAIFPKGYVFEKNQEWNTDVAGAFPHLAKLLIAGCPELTNGLPTHLPSLLILEIRACPQLVVSISEAPLLTEINVFDGSSGRINASVLYGGGQCLQFREYPQLKGMEQMSHVDPSFFTDVEIDRCSSFNSCRLDLLPQVSTLTVKQCLNLESLCIGERSLPGLRHLTVRHCPNLVSFPRGGLAV